MCRRPIAWLVVCSSCGGSPAPAEQPRAPIPSETEAAPQEQQEFVPFSESSPETVATTTLASSAAEIAPGSRFTVALHFDIAPGYRLGWIYPGDVGQATKVHLSAPEGFEVGAAKFPGPERFKLSGGLISYGYEDEAAAFAEVHAPQNLDRQQVYRFEVKATWMVCKRECLTEGTEAYFELRAGHGASTGFEPHLEALQARVPEPLSNLNKPSFEWQSSKSLLVSAKDVTWEDFFPAGKALRPEQVIPKGERLRLVFGGAATEHEAVGVARGQVEGQPKFVQLQKLEN